MQGRGGANASIANVCTYAYAIAMHVVIVTNQDDEDNMNDYISRHKKITSWMPAKEDAGKVAR